MFDLFENDLFVESVQDIFNVLDHNYVEDLCKELLPRLNGTFDQLFETKFLIVENATGKPVSKEAGSGQAIRAHLRPRWSSNLDPP